MVTQGVLSPFDAAGPFVVAQGPVRLDHRSFGRAKKDWPFWHTFRTHIDERLPRGPG